MAHTIPFDTHAYVKRLTAAGMPEAQAEVQAEAFAELINDQLATKRDLAELEMRLGGQSKELEMRLTHQMKQLELSITVKLGAMLVAAVAALAALDKFY